jgi:hypothetical protein
MIHTQTVEFATEVAFTGDLRVPERGIRTERAALVVTTGPSSVPQEAIATHAERLTAAGYVTLTVMANQAEPGGRARLSVLAAMDYLVANPSLDIQSIGIVEIGWGVADGARVPTGEGPQLAHPDATSW